MNIIEAIKSEYESSYSYRQSVHARLMIMVVIFMCFEAFAGIVLALCDEWLWFWFVVVLFVIKGIVIVFIPEGD